MGINSEDKIEDKRTEPQTLVDKWVGKISLYSSIFLKSEHYFYLHFSPTGIRFDSLTKTVISKNFLFLEF